MLQFLACRNGKKLMFSRGLTFLIEKFMCVIFCFFVYVLFGLRFAHLEFSVYV